tara:strand:+ start:327 stop:1004 length:678 start_codon:yes stop_codon:yes gene_type:complete
MTTLHTEMFVQEKKVGAKGSGNRNSRKLKSRTQKYCRMLHAYLSAFAFLILMFFAASGLLLNHPEWFAGGEIGEDKTTEANFSIEALSDVASINDEGIAFAEFAKERLPLLGDFHSAEVFPEEEAFLKFSGSKGNSDVVIDLVNGKVEYEVTKASLVEIMHNLHRGKDSGAVWSKVIDVSAILILVMSMFGFLLMFFIKFRLVNSMVILGTSVVFFAVIYAFFVS